MPEARLRHMPALDGLRALAVAAVLLYHGDVEWARGGYLGVDAFFVLSGFLITTLLLTEWRTSGAIDLPNFWRRRARRLLPALFLVLGAVALFATTWATVDMLDRLRGDVFATLGYVANWRFISSNDSYFAQFASPSPLQHVWSLAIEEQFYLVWPPMFLLLLRLTRGSRRALLAITLGLAAGSAVLMAALFSRAAILHASTTAPTRARSLSSSGQRSRCSSSAGHEAPRAPVRLPSTLPRSPPRSCCCGHGCARLTTPSGSTAVGSRRRRSWWRW